MNEITRSSRVTTALQVIQRMNEGLSLKEACSEVGMPRSTYYYVIARDTEAIAMFQDMVTANHRERLWMILVNQVNILQRLIDDGLAETTKTKNRLAIYKALGEMRDNLAQELRVNRRDDVVAAEYLRGPTLRKGISRLTASSTVDEN